ncbi:MAG: GNAT family N-acetyltransferase [Lentimicrobiaceae bacterium]|jgi:RimJ/RimL family protein N-acetyltransferase|nr:GNAT family N-acetyltransferase [Lentimicrobiaceae bacterium]
MNKQIIFRPIEDTDIELIEKWLMKPYIKTWFSPINEWIDEICKRKDAFSWLNHFMVFVQEKPIGFCQYYDCFDTNNLEDWYDVTAPNAVYSLDYLIGEENYLGKGYGKTIIKLLTEKVVSLGASRIIVNPDHDNEKSIGVLKANGFALSADGTYYLKEFDKKDASISRYRLLENTSKIHTTPLGAERMKRNLALEVADVVGWCVEKIKEKNCKITRKGKNWYAETDHCIITINAHNYTIITAHKTKRKMR